MNAPIRPIRKSWHFSLAQSESLYRLLDETLVPLGCSALVLPGGQALHMRPSGPADLATLPQAASLCLQYLRLGDLDGALLNDPFSGGTTLSELTLVVGVCFETAGPEAEVLLARRIPLPVRLSETDKLDDQGVRIPPTPLATRGKLNMELLGAVSAHPLAPKNFADIVKTAFDEMLATAQEIKNLARDPGGEFKKANFKRYLTDSSLAFEVLMSRLPLGTTLVTTQLPSGETIKLQLEINEKRVHFDFAGTDASVQIGMTDLVTLGACVASTAAALKTPIPLNAGSFEHILVSTPSKTLLSSRAPTGIFKGINTGVAAVCALVQTAFAKLNTSFRAAHGAGADGHFELRFKDGRVFSGRVAPGTGASKDQTGHDGIALWSSRLTATHSIEREERKAPVTVSMAGLRGGSGGKGKLNGGDGALRVLTVAEPGEFRWSMGRMMERHDGIDSGRAGSQGEIEIVRANGTVETLSNSEGVTQIGSGDQIRIFAAGGGAYGEPPAES